MEFSDAKWNTEEVKADLLERAGPLGAEVRGEGGWEVDGVTIGVKSQPKRTNKGRTPIIGEIAGGEYIFTGLGSRGFLWHGEYGKRLARVILGDEGEDEDGAWWRKEHVKTGFL